MNTIKNAFETVKETLSRAVSTSDLNSTVPLADIKALEETERAVRIEESTPALVAQNNAKLVSSFISSTNFPYFKGGLNKGFKNYTRRAEEMERARMLASKQELALKKNNAFLLSSQIKALGWPFMRDGPSVLLTDSFKLMEEEERDRRLADKQWAMNSRNNAALVSNLVRWDNYQRHTTAGLKRITRNMEEKERQTRVEDRAEQERAADLAFQTSGLIRRLGWPFYVQPSLDNKEMTREIEEEEKNRRLVNPHERLIAQENAGLVANLMHAKDTGFLSEKEKERRIEDALEQERHQAHAKRIAGIIAKRYDPSELERQRLLADKAHTREAQLGAKKVAEIVPHFMSVSSWSINRAVEKERARKLNDITGTAFAKHNANKIANIVMDADLEKKTAWTNELEQERMRRMHDRVASDLAKKNARKVSKMVLRNNTSSLSLAEGERARRLGDLNEQSRHKLLAQKQAELIRQRSAVPIASTPAGYPAASGLESALPTSSSSLPVGSATRSVPMFEQQAPLLQQQAPLLQQQAPLLQQQAPLFQQQAPMYTTGPTYIGQQPVLNNGMYASPLAAAPMLASPSVYSTGPIYTSPSTLPVTYSSPSVLPVTYRSPASVPVTFGAMPGTTYTTSTTYLPGTTPAYVPYDAGVPSHLRVMTDKERRKMEKQASRHSRTSQREARKAEHDLSKAEKLHFKGKDDRAIKYESRAEQHNVAAKHHQAWAQELAADSLSHTLPSALPTVYRPAM